MPNKGTLGVLSDGLKVLAGMEVVDVPSSLVIVVTGTPLIMAATLTVTAPVLLSKLPSDAK